MNELVERAKAALLTGGYTCVVCGKQMIETSAERGVKPLVRWVEQRRDFSGCAAADKVVGKATAFLYVLLRVETVYAAVISHAALQTLTAHGVTVTYGQAVEYIVNRQGDGVCPFERAVWSLTSPAEAYQTIRRQMERMGITL